VLAGTEQQKVQRTADGIGDNFFPNPFGSQRIGAVTRTRLLLLVTPTVIATPK
jgi:hypothetical protein